jgi:DNA-binding beta-propeller fold protein YncE
MFPEFCEFDQAGNIVVSDHNNHCIQVLHYGDGTILRSFGIVGEAGDDENHLRNPCAFDIHSAHGLIFVADYGNHRVQVLNYLTGTYVRTIRYVCKSKSPSHSDDTYPTSVAVNPVSGNAPPSATMGSWEVSPEPISAAIVVGAVVAEEFFMLFSRFVALSIFKAMSFWNSRK